MPKRKFEDSKLKKLVAQGFTVNQIAEKFGVSGVAIRKRLKELEIIVSRDTALNPATAQRIADGSFDAAERLMEIHTSAMDTLKKLENVFNGHADPSTLEPLLGGKVAPSELYHKMLAEVRKQLSLCLDIYKAMADMREVMEFQRIVLEEIKAESRDCQARIVNRLVKQQHIASSIALAN